MNVPSEHATGRRTLNAAGYEVLAYTVNTAIRFGANLLLTRLLVPEAFGLMALCYSVMFVLGMLSDVGTSQAVIMSPRGDDPKFLNTIWTIQAGRGVFLWLACLLATWPCAVFLKEPRLLWLLPVVGFTSVIHGFSSTRPLSLRRHLRLGPIQLVLFVSMVVSSSVNVGGAYLGYGVPALAAGAVASTVWEAVASYYMPGRHKPRWQPDLECRKEILHFGRWIFLSSCLTAVSIKGDQFVLVRLLGFDGLGMYNIALNLADVPEALAGRVIAGAVYPALARAKENGPRAFTKTYYDLRRWMDPAIHVSLGGLMALSHWIVGFLYDDRYAAAGTMLQILAFRSSIQMLSYFCENAFLAHGESNFQFRRNLFVTSVLLVSMPIGHMLGGIPGLLYASVLARSTALIALWPHARRRGFLLLRYELLVIPYLAIGYGLGRLLLWILPAV